MADYHVGAGCFGINAGTLNKKGNLWQNKTECTDEAINAVQWLSMDIERWSNCRTPSDD